MKKPIGLSELLGFAVTSLVGTLLHFLYDLSGNLIWLAPISGVNESTWEHMKLLFWPMFIYAVLQSFFFRDRDEFWCVKLRGILFGLSLIPILFYTYNGAVGKSPDWLNIAIFFISAAASYMYETKEFNKTFICKKPYRSFAAICIIALMFILFTFITPKIGIFKDPLTGTYGV